MGRRDWRTDNRAVRVAGGDRRAARAAAYRALARRPRSAAQIRERLERAGYDEVTVDAVLTDLSAAGYVNDHAFARDWARACMERKGFGRQGLRLELERQGVPRDIIAETLDEVYHDVDERAVAVQLAARWLRPSLSSPRPAGERARVRGPEMLKLQRRVRDRLLRRGFGFEVVNAVLRKSSDAPEGCG